jgi:hypothetical protein
MGLYLYSPFILLKNSIFEREESMHKIFAIFIILYGRGIKFEKININLFANKL